MAPSIPSADEISNQEFQEWLDRYPSCIAVISQARGAKDGQKTLQELDEYRYGEAIDQFSGSKVRKAMELDHVKELVSWKLRHGKFRPTLMKLVSSNDAAFAQDTIQAGFALYDEKRDASAALDVLTKLKGVGPATASVLLAVHDPKSVIFFADEAFWWLCCAGRQDAIKYNMKEFKELSARSETLARRLGVPAVDIERVAFAVMRQGDAVSPPAAIQPKANTTSKLPKPTAEAAVKKQSSLKREANLAEGEAEAERPVRRSKRGKGA